MSAMWLTCLVVATRPQRGVCRRSNYWIARACFDKRRRCIVRGDKTESVSSFVEVHRSKFGLADARCVLQHGLEHCVQLAGRTADYLEHLGSRGLLLSRRR